MNDWRPDWRDLSNYPFAKQRPNRWWAWQFARRNKYYEAAWELENKELQAHLEELRRQTGEEFGTKGTAFPSWEWNKRWGFSRPLDPAIEDSPHNVLFTGRTMAIAGGSVGKLRNLRGPFQMGPKLIEDDSRCIGYLDLSRELMREPNGKSRNQTVLGEI